MAARRRTFRVSESQPVITAEAALQIVAGAIAHAQSLHVAVNVAVVDASGLPAAFARMPGAPLHSIDFARDKAYTAASFGLATSAWPRALKSHSPAVQDGLVRHPRFIGFGGGLPISRDGSRLGGVGVSGGSESQDEAIARAGIEAINAVIERVSENHGS